MESVSKNMMKFLASISNDMEKAFPTEDYVRVSSYTAWTNAHGFTIVPVEDLKIDGSLVENIEVTITVRFAKED